MRDRTVIGIRARRLCMVLRSLRKKTGMTSAQVGKQIGVSASKVSRAESGKRGITSEDLASMLTVYGVSRELRAALMRLHADAHKPDLLDRGELHVHEDLETWIGFEQDAAHLRNYEPLLVPGLLQTFPYARAVIEAGVRPRTKEEIDDQVAARVARQSLLRRLRPLVLDVILHEAVLHQRIGGPEVMSEQLGYLIEAAARAAITIRIVPGDVGAHPGMDGPFVIMDYFDLPSLVHVENKVASLYLEEAADVRAYRLAFEGLLAVALSSEDSINLIARIARSMV